MGKYNTGPIFPIEDFPVTHVGASLSFQSSLHKDSGVYGIVENIAYAPPTHGSQRFHVYEAAATFDLSTPAMVLQPNHIVHATAPYEHDGLGLVLMTKQGTTLIDRNIVDKPLFLDKLKPQPVYGENHKNHPDSESKQLNLGSRR